jgi:uncharacterized protein YqgV (UPF0045/DUF77 family)
MSKGRAGVTPSAESPGEVSLVRVEFMIEPFHDAAPGAHVKAAVNAVKGLGLKAEMGPFGTSVVGPEPLAVAAVGAVTAAALAHGATRVSVQIERVTR